MVSRAFGSLPPLNGGPREAAAAEHGRPPKEGMTIVTSPGPVLIAARWRSRRSAAVAGVLFALLLITAIVTMRLATEEADLETLASDEQRRSLIAISLQIVPFAGIAFLWFIGVVRDQLGQVEDRLFSTVFLGSGLLFLATLFQGAVTETSMLTMLAQGQPDVGVWSFGSNITEALISIYAMRMAAVFTLSVSSVVVRTRAIPRWVALLGFAVGILLLVTGGANRWVALAFPGWVLLLSVVILFTRPPDRTPAAP